MMTIDLSKKEHSLAELLALAKSEAVLIHSASGEDFVLEQADAFDREVVALGRGGKFMAFLKRRSSETGDVALDAVRKRRCP
jgi:hypothetical protein